ncbi:ABC transporter permease [bacterium]|nr:ABC transporter permease [bacterium]NBW57756.1 ABC transporter permease [bacterium]NBX72144.1 ABC transporter permease [bacterium]
MTVDLFLTGILQGLILSILAYGIMIPFRLLNFPDLTAEGSYPLGGALCATALSYGISPVFALLIALVGSGLLGIATSLVYLRLGVNTLLAGIILSTMTYSLNLRIMAKPNIALFDTVTIFSDLDCINNIMVLTGIILAIQIPFTWFLKTELGLSLRAVGLNADFAKKQGICVSSYTQLGLFLGSALAGLAGALTVQLNQYMDISIGVGIVIHALAALMIGEVVLGTQSMFRQLSAPLLGSLLYQQLQGLVLSIGLEPSDLKLFTGITVLAVISIKKLNQRI